MRSLISACIIFILALELPAANATTIAKPRGTTVVVTQTVAGPSLGSTSKIVVEVGRFEVIKGNIAQSKGTVRPGDITPFKGLDVTDYGGSLTTGQIQSIAAGVVSSARSSILAQLGSLVKDKGATTGIFIYEQDIVAVSVTGRARLVWQVIVDSSGRTFEDEVKVVKANSTYLYVSYTPKRLWNGLPQAWGYPDGGRLTWMLVDSKLNPISAPVSVQTGGYFDEPSGSHGGETQVRCLISKASSGCGSPYPDVLQLISDNSADGAYVDFLHPISPFYDDVEAPAGSGQFVSYPRLVLNVVLRQVSHTLDVFCKNPQHYYQNAGQFQMQLKKAMTRYFVNKATSGFSPVAQLSTVDTSPVASYDYTVQVSDESLPLLDQLFIDPFLGDTALISTGYLTSQSTLAPYVNLPYPACVPPPPPTGGSGSGSGQGSGSGSGTSIQ